ncbi:MAG: ABC transporter permease subunit [Tissierellia bacterium]|jgi:ABC-2 type transport system permease protein|nr:ABC transporter permease subunit [Tissierellia bacterium]
MNIIKRELRANLKSMIIWSFAMAFLVMVWMIEFESFANSPYIDDFMNSIPSGILSVFGMSNLDISSLNGFIGTISLYLYLLLGIQAVLLGSSIISKEERDKTAEYLFSLPVSRKKVIWNKIVSAIINLIILNLITGTTMILSTISYNKEPGFYRFIILMFLGVFLIQTVFLSIGMLVASVNKRYKKSGNISVTILMITFIIASLINTVDKLDFLKYITPFKYFDSSYILNEKALEPIFIFISIGIIGIGIVGTLVFYPKRDLHI